jgi:hypothetical protein
MTTKLSYRSRKTQVHESPIQGRIVFVAMRDISPDARERRPDSEESVP